MTLVLLSYADQLFCRMGLGLDSIVVTEFGKNLRNGMLCVYICTVLALSTRFWAHDVCQPPEHLYVVYFMLGVACGYGGLPP